MTGVTDHHPPIAEAAYLTEALRRCGVLAGARVSAVAIESANTTIMSRVLRLRLAYDGPAPDAP